MFVFGHFVLLLWLQCRNTIEITSFQIHRPFLLILSPHPSLLLLKLHHHQPWLVTCRRNFHWKLLVKELYVFLPGRSHQGVGAGGLHRGVIAKPLAVTGTLIQVKKNFVQRKEKKERKKGKKNLHSFSYPFENSSRGWDICGRWPNGRSFISTETEISNFFHTSGVVCYWYSIFWLYIFIHIIIPNNFNVGCLKIT